MSKNKILYKSLPTDMSPHGFKFTKGKWHKIDGEIKICERGFHASKNIIDAMGYVPAEVLAKVEVRGKSDIEDTKECWSEMRLIKTYKWTKKDSVSLAIFSAELVLENFEKKYPKDLRPREAIEAAKNVLKNDTEENRSAARSAAWSAAASAAESAWSAAWSAAASAAESAAESARSAAESAASAAASAAESAAESARSAAESALKKQLHDYVIKRVKLQ